MIFSLVKFRKSKGAVPDTKMVHSTKAEILWTIIPVVILVGMAVPAAKRLIKIEDASNTDITIKVTGYQWKWQYEYLDEDVSFFSTLSRDSDAARQLGFGNRSEERDRLPAERGQPAGGAGGQRRCACC